MYGFLPPKKCAVGIFLCLLFIGMVVYIAFFNKGETNPVDLSQQGLSFKEVSDYFEDVAKTKGAEYAFDVLRYAVLPVNTDIHLLAHTVGDELYKQKGLSGMEICTQEFRNACSHSVVVGAFIDKGEGVLDEIRDVCTRAPGGSGAYTMCFHGFGHGVLAYFDYEFDVVPSLCERVGTKEYRNREYAECVGGALMELTGGVHDVATRIEKSEKYFKKSDPLYPCTASFIPSEVQPVCYTYLTPHLFETAGGDLGSLDSHDYKKAFTYCDALPQDQIENRTACFGGFGKEFVVLAQDRDIRVIDGAGEDEFKKIAGWCSLSGDKKGVLDCVDSALQSFYWGGENERGTAIQFCASLTESAHQTFCFTRLIGSVSYFIDDPIYRRDFCNELPPEHQDVCRESLVKQ
ncbi:MAG: hypothetical protein WD509_00860 [Candidatus Paceibacterota bacterium]